MDENVRKPLTFLAVIAIFLALGLGYDRVKAMDTFQADFGEGKDLSRVVNHGSRAELVYKVQPGDVWWKIARDHDISTRALLEANGADPSMSLTPGQNIRLPAATVPVAPSAPPARPSSH